MLRKLLSNIFHHINTKTVCPPGNLPVSEGVNIIVSSLMRSGTHLAMDFIFNNFKQYKTYPLYIDYDRYCFDGHNLEELSKVKGAVLKTHFIQRPFNEQSRDFLKVLGKNAIVIIPDREAKQVNQSLSKWEINLNEEELKKLREEHLAFWSGYSPLVVPFDSYFDKNKMLDLKKDIASRINVVAENRVVLPSTNSFPNMVNKLSTRIVGNKWPVINTGIGFKIKKRMTQ